VSLALLGLLAVACGGGSGSTNNAGSGSGSGSGSSNAILTIANTGGSQWTCGFNPFNPAVQGVTVGFVYEPLVYINTLKNAAETPMLATKYSWGAGKKSLTFTIRDGVKWNDGKPFTAKDVAFTFNELKKYPGLDLNALWKSILTKVTATNDKTVAFEFKGAAQPYFYYIADQVSIVPEHIWTTGQAAKDPVQFNDPAPVGTGPYTVNPCKPANITYKANPTYWQSGLPKVKTVNYPAYTDNSPANLDLATGKAQWGGQFIPSVDKYYVAKDKANHHYWYPPVSNVDLVFNLKNGGMGIGKINPSVPASYIKLMNSYKAKIIAGTLKVPAALEAGLTEACRAGGQHLVSIWGHPDQEEGPRAFAEKREPDFSAS